MAVFTGSGSAASPSITFSADTNTGIFSPGADQVSITTNGTERLRINATGQVGSVSLGTAAAPVYTFTGDPNTGIFSPGADQVAISTNGTNRLHITSAGNVGIGTSGPAVTLDVLNIHGINNSITRPFRIRNYGQVSATGYGVGMSFFYPNGTTSDFGFEAAAIDSSFTAGGNFGNLIFGTNNNAGVTEKMRLTQGGGLGIGKSPVSLLDVLRAFEYRNGSFAAGSFVDLQVGDGIANSSAVALFLIRLANTGNTNSNFAALVLMNSRNPSYGGGAATVVSTAQGSTGTGAEITGVTINRAGGSGTLRIAATTVNGTGTIAYAVRQLNI